MKKHWLLILLSSFMLFGCYDPNEWWTDEETKSMVQYAQQMFKEVETIVNDYDGAITSEHYDDTFKSIQCHNVHINILDFIVNNNLYSFYVDLIPNKNDEVELHDITLHISTPTYNNPDECVFIKENFMIINELLHYLNNYVSADFFVDLDQITYYMNASKKSYEENDKEKRHGIIVKINNRKVDYEGWFAFVKKNEENLYYNSVWLEFSKCPDKFN